jgi:hypothetical protein
MAFAVAPRIARWLQNVWRRTCHPVTRSLALLRRHGLYSSHLVDWRAQYRSGALRGLTPRPRGPKPQPKNPLADRRAKLERAKARLEKRLRQAETIIEVPKKLSELLGIPLPPQSSDGND